jgi:hypothetical protein
MIWCLSSSSLAFIVLNLKVYLCMCPLTIPFFKVTDLSTRIEFVTGTLSSRLEFCVYGFLGIDLEASDVLPCGILFDSGDLLTVVLDAELLLVQVISMVPLANTTCLLGVDSPLSLPSGSVESSSGSPISFDTSFDLSPIS